MADDDFVDVELNLDELGAAAVGVEPRVHVGLWRPSTAPGGALQNLTTLVQFSPYFGETERIAAHPSGRIGGFLLDSILTGEFAVLQVSLLGTGFSTHCFDLLGDQDRASMAAVFDWIVEQPWSNGDVLTVGAGYDGAAALWGAALGHEAVVGTVALNAPTDMRAWFWPHGATTIELAAGPVRHGLLSVDSFVGEPGIPPSAFVDGKDVQVVCKARGEELLATVNADEAFWQERTLRPSASNPALLVYGALDHMVPADHGFKAQEVLTNSRLIVGPWGFYALGPEAEELMVPFGSSQPAPAMVQALVVDWLLDPEGGQDEWIWTGEAGPRHLATGFSTAQPYGSADCAEANPGCWRFDLERTFVGTAELRLHGDAPFAPGAYLLRVTTGDEQVGWGVAGPNADGTLTVPIQATELPPGMIEVHLDHRLEREGVASLPMVERVAELVLFPALVLDSKSDQESCYDQQIRRPCEQLVTNVPGGRGDHEQRDHQNDPNPGVDEDPPEPSGHFAGGPSAVSLIAPRGASNITRSAALRRAKRWQIALSKAFIAVARLRFELKSERPERPRIPNYPTRPGRVVAKRDGAADSHPVCKRYEASASSSRVRMVLR